MEDLYRVESNAKLGRYLVASEFLKMGTLVFSDVPYVYGPKPDSPAVCLGCHKVWDGKYKCSLCGWPCCSAVCEQLTIHRNNECQVFVKSKTKYQDIPRHEPCLQYDCITPLRFLIERERSEDRWNEEINAMEDHREERMTNPTWQVDQVNIVEYLRGPCDLAERFTEGDIQRVCGILEVNAVEVPFKYGTNLRAIYPKVAIMSHNCVPSIFHTIVIEGNTSEPKYLAQIWAATDIKKGQKLELCYTHVLQTTLERRDFLRASKFFDCDCSRCSDPTELGTEMSTLLCNQCDSGYVRALNPLDSQTTWKCSNCNFERSNANVRELMKVINEEILLTEKYGKGSAEIDNIELLISWLSGILHSQHCVFILLKYNLLQLYGNVKGHELESLSIELIKKKIDLCRDVLMFLDIVTPGHSRLKGVTLYELHGALISLLHNEYKNSSIDEEQFKRNMFEAASILLESGTILSKEDEGSQRGILGRLALTSYSDILLKLM